MNGFKTEIKTSYTTRTENKNKGGFVTPYSTRSKANIISGSTRNIEKRFSSRLIAK